MAITQRAQAWLSTLSRETPMPTAEVEKLLVDAGHTPHKVWLDFQEHYAGYIEEVGPGEIAIWGLARAADTDPPPIFYQPDQVYYVAPEHWFPEALRCADANPTHDYELGSDGRFRGLGGPAATFEMKLERHGLMHEFHQRGGDLSQRFVTRKADEPQHQQLIAQLQGALVREASDQGRQYFSEPHRLVSYSPFIKQLVIWELDP